MTGTKKNEPKREAIRLSRFWQTHGPNTYPLDISQLIDGTICSSSFSDELVVTIRPFDSFEGSLVRTNGTRKWTLLLNSNISNKRRQRFTFAHELGHFMCHRELRSSFRDSEETLNDFRDELEMEANIFASWLLMPANIVRKEFGNGAWNADTLCRIGNRFECSLQASALRYVDLCPKPVAFVVSRDGTIIWACKSKSAPYLNSFCFGDELPEQSHTLQCYKTRNVCREPIDVGTIWNDSRSVQESQYYDQSSLGYQYTCLEF